MKSKLKLLYWHGEKRNPYFILRQMGSLNGLFSYVIEDIERNELILLQDRFGDSAWLYYTIINGQLYYSNDFHEICGKISLPSLDMEAVRQRLMTDFVWGDRTLIAQIKKVPLHCIMIFNRGTKQINYYRIKFEGGDRSGNIIKNGAYEAILPRYPEVSAVAYSAGFESNMLVHNYYHPDLQLFTIGANKGRDDSTNARKIINNSVLPNENLHIYKPTTDLLDIFPKLVSICGENWNKGAFTIYLLGMALKKQNISSILIGEGGNEAFTLQYNFFLESNSINWNFENKPEYWAKGSSSLGMVANRAIKRTGAIMNYFGVEPIWPFLDLGFLNSIEAEDEQHEAHKRYHKRVLEMIHPDSRKLLITQGGSFELTNLFEREDDFQKYLEFAKQSKYFPIYENVKGRINGKDEETINWVFNILFIHLFEEIFINRKEITTLDEMLDL